MTIDKKTERDIKRIMRELLCAGECIDKITGEADLTGLAETAANELGHDEWLDDELHIVWDLAIEVAEEFDLAESA